MYLTQQPNSGITRLYGQHFHAKWTDNFSKVFLPDGTITYRFLQYADICAYNAISSLLRTNMHILETYPSIADLETYLGGQLRQLRLRQNLDQRVLAGRANVSVRALQNLEGGKGATLKTMLAVLRTLGRIDLLALIAPEPSVSPMKLLSASKPPRKRVYAPRKKPL